MTPRTIAARTAAALAVSVAALGMAAGTASASPAPSGSAPGRLPTATAPGHRATAGADTTRNQGCEFQVIAPNINIRNAPDGTAIQPAPENSYLVAGPEEYDTDGQTWFFGMDLSNGMVGWVGGGYLSFLGCLGVGGPDAPAALPATPGRQAPGRQAPGWPTGGRRMAAAGLSHLAASPAPGAAITDQSGCAFVVVDPSIRFRSSPDGSPFGSAPQGSYVYTVPTTESGSEGGQTWYEAIDLNTNYFGWIGSNYVRKAVCNTPANGT